MNSWAEIGDKWRVAWEKRAPGQEKTSIPGRAAITRGQVKINLSLLKRLNRKNAGKA
jgi:hypothetical protein